MKIRYERPVSHAASWARRLGLFVMLLFLVSAALHRLGMIASETFAALLALSGVIAVLTLLLSAQGLLRLWMVGAKGGVASVSGLFFSLVVLVPVGLLAFRFYTLPPLNDISTDRVDPPEFLEPVQQRMISLPFLGSASGSYEGQVEAYPRVTGRRYDGAVDRVLEAVREVAENTRISILRVSVPVTEPPADQIEGSVIDRGENPSPGQNNSTAASPVILLQGESRAMILGLESDVSIRLSEEAETTYVDVRSVSRFGPHDLGTNAEIITAFLAALDAELLGISVR